MRSSYQESLTKGQSRNLCSDDLQEMSDILEKVHLRLARIDEVLSYTINSKNTLRILPKPSV